MDRLKQLKLPTLKYRRARGDMIELFKILHGFYDNTSNDNTSKLSRLTLELLQEATNMNCIKVLLNMILKSTFLLIEWCHYGIVYRMKLWILSLLIVLKVDLINFGIINLLNITGMASLELGTGVYVIKKVYENRRI